MAGGASTVAIDLMGVMVVDTLVGETRARMVTMTKVSVETRMGMILDMIRTTIHMNPVKNTTQLLLVVVRTTTMVK